MNKHGVSKRWFTETDVKHLKSRALRTITNIAEKEYTFYGILKKNFSARVFQRFFFIDAKQLY